MPNKTNQVFLGILIMITLLLSACAGKQMVVNNADTLLEHQIKKRLPLYSAQKVELSKDVNKFLHDQKPVARELLPVIDSINLDPKEKIDKKYNEVISFYFRIAQDFSVLFSKHMVSLDYKQQRDFFEILEEENRQIGRRDPHETEVKVTDRFKKFFGSVNGPQKELLTKYLAYFQKRTLLRLERRKALQNEFREIFSHDLSPASRAQMFSDAFAKYYKNSMDHEKNLEMLQALLPTLTSVQKEHFRKRVEDVKEILNYFLQADY